MAIYYGNKKVSASDLSLDFSAKQVNINFKNGSPIVVATVNDLPSEGSTSPYVVSSTKRWYWYNPSTNKWVDQGDYIANSNVRSNGAVTSVNADYAEVGEWEDGNPSGENRTGYFVALSKTSTTPKIKIANSTDDVRGVTVTRPAFAAGFSFDISDAYGSLYPTHAYVGFAGLVSVKQDGTITRVGQRAMPNDNGIATLSDNNLGYQVVQLVGQREIMVVVEPSADMLQRIKNDIAELQELHDIAEIYQNIDNDSHASVIANRNNVITLLNSVTSLEVDIPSEIEQGYSAEINYITGNEECPIKINNKSTTKHSLVYYGRIYDDDYVVPRNTRGSLFLSHNGREILCFTSEIRE